MSIVTNAVMYEIAPIPPSLINCPSDAVTFVLRRNRSSETGLGALIEAAVGSISVMLFDAAHYGREDMRAAAAQNVLEQGKAALKEGKNDAARAHYLNAGKIMNSASLIFKAGSLYEKLDPKRMPLAAKCYQLALEQLMPYQASEEELKRLFTSQNLSAADAIEIGIMYHEGSDVKRNYREAFRWYDRARVIGAANPLSQGSLCGLAYRNMGALFENGQYGVQSYVEAVRCYRLAIRNRCNLAVTDITRVFHHPAIPKMIRKSIETTSLVYFLEGTHNVMNHNSLCAYAGEADTKNFRPMKRFVHHRLYKHAARLLVCGVSENKELDSLNYAERYKITRLRAQVVELVKNLNEPAPSVLFHTAMNNTVRDRNPHIISQARLEELYQNDLIKPLLEFGKLAALGLHRLSEESNDDSDDDDTNEAIKSRQRLSIEIDWAKDTVEKVYPMPGSDTCLGVYDFRGSHIYVGAKVCANNSPEKVRGTFVHELTHFIAYEVFANDCVPYREDDLVNAKQFRTDIADDLKGRHAAIDPTLSIIFTHIGYNNPAMKSLQIDRTHDSELIARVAEMIVKYSDGLAKLTKQAPRLLAYYRNVFLPAVESHIAKCKSRALGGWPEALLKEAARTTGQ